MAAGKGTGPVALGRVSRTVGLRGEVRVKPHHPGSGSFGSLGRVLISRPEGLEDFQIRSARRTKGGTFVLKLRGVDSVEQASELVGLEVLADRDELAPLHDGSYYWADLIGLRVIGEDGADIGLVESMIETGANDVFVVRRRLQGDELLLPNIPEVIREVDQDLGVIRVRLMPGLLSEEE